MKKDAFYRQVSKIVRAALNCSGTSYPIEFEDGFSPPRQEGTYHHWETRGGRRIYHPSAYSKNGWSNMVYIPSSICLVVGKGWVLEEMVKKFALIPSCLSQNIIAEEKARKAWENILEAANDGAYLARAKFTSEGGIVLGNSVN